MSESSESNELTVKQLRNILQHEHIRKHLVRAGYIDEHGNVVRATKDESQLKRPQTARTRRSAVKSNSRLPSASTTKKSKTSTRLSSINQPTFISNVLLRRAVSPKLLYPDERCEITLKYNGPDLNIDYDRDLFEPQGDEILLLQQHCGGENSLVVKCFLKPNETTTFHSRRHTDYPFALAFYLNGVIKDRLSVCCEFRCRNSMPIGGKRSLITIVKVENDQPCRRCRYEQRIQKLWQSESNASRLAQRDFIKMNIERVSKSPKRQLTRKNIHSKPEPQSPGVAPGSPAITKKSPAQKSTDSSSPQSVVSRSPSPEREVSKKSVTSPRVSSSSSSPEPTPPKRNTTKRISSPPQVSSGESSPRPSSSTINHQTAFSRKDVNRFPASDGRSPSPPVPNRFSSSNNEEQTTHSLPNKPPATTFSENRKKTPPHISTDDESEEEVATLSDESSSDFNRFSHTDRRRNDTSD